VQQLDFLPFPKSMKTRLCWGMAYRISASTGIGAVSIIVETAEEAVAKIAEYREDGLAQIVVRDMHGLEVDQEQLLPSAD
jgi:hypothetical protein